MAPSYNKELYKEHVELMEALEIFVPDTLEITYKKYIHEEMEKMPYVDNSVLKMYTLVFFLKYIKKIEGSVKFKDVYAKLELQKKLISRAMGNIDVDFNNGHTNPTLTEDWSSLYSIALGVGAGIKRQASEETPPFDHALLEDS
ncbi:hypothetical protein NEDG_01652 [Nematocida displodere]|uniref:Uncharacterized protein n=1 Tax=Nematocida displodere TaxID=1805483 RepID=A0A177EJS7_9MICR|nr:hypothetical protein NEDG_01652 [Nematocida displodere]